MFWSWGWGLGEGGAPGPSIPGSATEGKVGCDCLPRRCYKPLNKTVRGFTVGRAGQLLFATSVILRHSLEAAAGAPLLPGEIRLR